MLDKLQIHLKRLNDSKFLMGVAMLLLNVGSKYVEMGFSKTQEEALRNGIGREILIFAMVFMGTHDIILSIIMTASFVVLSNYLFNEKSKFCLIPSRLESIARITDKNNDKRISQAEEKAALDTLRKAEEQKKKEIQGNFTSYLGTYKL
jgi:hypothetical protein